MASSATVTLENEIILVKYRLATKYTAKISSRIGEKPSKTPALVATAFPPLNPAKIGKCAPKQLRDQRPSVRSLEFRRKSEGERLKSLLRNQSQRR